LSKQKQNSTAIQKFTLEVIENILHCSCRCFCK